VTHEKSTVNVNLQVRRPRMHKIITVEHELILVFPFPHFLFYFLLNANTEEKFYEYQYFQLI